jgi:hypothetical protein
MGGWGSTRWIGHRRRLTVEEATRLPVGRVLAALADAGWVSAPHATVISADGHRQEVVAERRPQPFGGWRWSIVCPQCGRGCRAVYRPALADSWACRRCHQLGYHSQRLGRYWRMNRRLDRCWAQMGGTDGDLAGKRWPRRPKGMHQTTCERLRARWTALNDATWEEGLSSLGSLLARFGAAGGLLGSGGLGGIGGVSVGPLGGGK